MKLASITLAVAACMPAVAPPATTAPPGGASTTASSPPPAAGSAGSAAPVASAGPLAVTIEGTSFTIENRAIVESTRTPLHQHAHVPSGAGLALTVTLDRPGYVSVIEFHPSGGADVLYPVDTDPTGALAHHTIPADKNTVLQLDDTTGQELLYVIVSAQPLARADADLAQLVAEVAHLPSDQILPVAYATTSNDPVDLPPPPPPPPQKSAVAHHVAGACPPVTGAGNRLLTAKGPCDAHKPLRMLTAKGIHRTQLDGNALVGAHTDDHGVGAFAIAIDHTP